MGERLGIGIRDLDRRLNGGIPPGSIVAFFSEPACQTELLLYRLTATRGTLYLSFDRSETAVEDSIERSPVSDSNATVRHIPDEAPLNNAGKLISALPESSNIILDPVNVLEASGSPSRYRNFMNDLQNHIVNTDSLAVLHCFIEDERPALRSTTEHFADVVLRVETEVDGLDVEHKLAVLKFRGGRALSKAIKLEIEDEIVPDMSRDIA
jgi:KaiC/GvpD/RAD55 family RecA-like ATPase